jgi:hypothetical protein
LNVFVFIYFIEKNNIKGNDSYPDDKQYSRYPK